jgi:peptidoglycan biosynthesis protein MviN/MurJ (putative lipid II flippase)
VIVSYFARGYLARIIFARSNREIALIFGFLCIAIFFRILYTLIARYFYAYKDTKTPLYVTLFAIALNIVLTYNLAKPSAYGIVGLALAQCIVAVSEILIMVVVMMLRDHKIFDKRFYKFLAKAAAVSGFDIVTGYFVIRLIPLSLSDQGFIILLKVTVFASVIFFVHTAMSFVFGLKESQVVVNRIKRTILKPVKI